MRYIPQDVTAVGDRVLVEVRRAGRGSASGVQVDEQQFHVWDVVAGRAVRFRVTSTTTRPYEPRACQSRARGGF